MLKSEFINLIGKNIKQEEYDIIEKVYTWYDDNNLTKQFTATLYNTLGIKVFIDMLPRAEQIEQLDRQLQKVNNQQRELTEQINKLKIAG